MWRPYEDDDEPLNFSMDPPSSSRILYDVPCVVCRDNSSGKHYGVYACDGCAGFFKRSVRRNRQYSCKTRGRCPMDKTHRNHCRSCRLAKCLAVGMNRDAVQHERGPRNTAGRRAFTAESYSDQSLDIGASTSQPSANATASGIMIPRPMAPVPLYPFNPFMVLRPALPHVPTPATLLNAQPRTPLLRPQVIAQLPSEGIDNLCECAARLLFMNVKWVKGLAQMEVMSLQDRYTLLIESWKDIFVIASAHFMGDMNLRQFLNTNKSITTAEIKAYEAFIAEYRIVQPDRHEFTWLKLLSLFKTNIEHLQNPQAVSEAHRYYEGQLYTYETKYTHSMDAYRFLRVRLLLFLLNNISERVIVELFFKDTIETIPMMRIVVDMFNSIKLEP